MECTWSAMTFARAGPKNDAMEAELLVPKDRADASITSARPLESRPWRARGGLVGGGLGRTGDRRFLGAHGAHCVS